MKILDVKPTNIPRGELKTEENARKFVLELIDVMLKWRHKCNVIVPGDGEASAKAQRLAMYAFLTSQGQVTGSLKALKLCGLMSDTGYIELTAIATNSLLPTMAGTVR